MRRFTEGYFLSIQLAPEFEFCFHYHSTDEEYKCYRIATKSFQKMRMKTTNQQSKRPQRLNEIIRADITVAKRCKFKYFTYVGLEVLFSSPACLPLLPLPPSQAAPLVEPYFKKQVIVVSKIVASTLHTEG